MKCFSLVLIASLFAVVAFSEPIVDVPKIAGKTVAQVDQALGKPSSLEKTKYGPKRIYRNGSVEVVFIGGKADWITVSEMNSVSFNEQAIETLGLKSERPTFENSNVIRWEPHSIYRSVSVFPGVGHVDYAYIKVSTK